MRASKLHGPCFALVAMLAGAMAAGCSNDTLVGAGGEIVVYPLADEFPLTYVGYSTTREITVANTGRAPEELRAAIDPPFSVAAPQRVPGPGTASLVVTFSPTAPGPAAGTLSIVAGGTPFEVALDARAESALACIADACEVSHFDPQSGRCVREPATDGTACSTHCVRDGVCLEGICRGTDDPCDDDNPCTKDLMASDCSCLHERYPDGDTDDPDDPCGRKTCEDGVGWKVVKAPDGTVCGPVNECTGQFCTDGVCGPPADAPEGTICRAGTPCRKPSRCAPVDGVMQCMPKVGHSSTTLAPVWRVSPKKNRQIHYEAVADELDLYWVECDDGGCGLRSIRPLVDTTGAKGIQPDPAGYSYEAFDRFRGSDGSDLAPMFDGKVSLMGGLLLSRGVLYSTYRDGWLEAYIAENGNNAFRLDLSSLGTPVGRDSTAVNAHGDVVLLLADSGNSHTVIAVSPAGTISWTRQREGFVRGLVADEVGNIYFTEETSRRSSLVSLDGTGKERFAVNASPVAPLAAFNDRIVHGDGTLFDTQGETIGALPLLVPDQTLPPLIDLTSGWLAGYPVDRNGPDWTSFSLQRFDPASAEASTTLPLSRLSLPWDRSEPLLLAERSVLLAEGRGDQSCKISPELGERPGSLETNIGGWACLLTPGSYGGRATVHSSLWIAYDECQGSVAAFLLEVAGQNKRRLASRGWLGGGGQPGRGNQPLP